MIYSIELALLSILMDTQQSRIAYEHFLLLWSARSLPVVMDGECQRLNKVISFRGGSLLAPSPSAIRNYWIDSQNPSGI